MGDIVIAMPKFDDANRLRNIIKGSDIWEDSIICTKGSDILNVVGSREISVVICTKKLPDMEFSEVANYLRAGIYMILLTKDDSICPSSSNVQKLMMPFKSTDLIGMVKSFLPSGVSRDKPRKPKRSLADQKIIDEAKALLIDRKSMTEPDAFRYIQKTSMDTGRTMVESAQMIIMMNS